MNREFWFGRQVLLTGHTGFKGAWMSLWLRSLGAKVTGLALPPGTKPALWELVAVDTPSLIGDIRQQKTVDEAFDRVRPEIVVHMAAQSLVRRSYREPADTFATNVMGTINVLEACRRASSLECALIVTSDKVYAHRGSDRHFSESDELGGADPYSASKACTELVVQCYRSSFFQGGTRLATARAGNVIGGGDWSEDRVIPDCVRALRVGGPVTLRNPAAIRPWQHVLDPLAGYLLLVERLMTRPEDAPLAVNFGPDERSFETVERVVDAFSRRFDGQPGWVCHRGTNPPEAATLMLDSSLARRRLGWRSLLNLDEAIDWTAAWYRGHQSGADMLELTMKQINEYEKLSASSAFKNVSV